MKIASSYWIDKLGKISPHNGAVLFKNYSGVKSGKLIVQSSSEQNSDSSTDLTESIQTSLNSVVETLRKEIIECQKTIKILQSQVVTQQEQITASLKEKKLTDQILMNLKSEVTLLKKASSVNPNGLLLIEDRDTPLVEKIVKNSNVPGTSTQTKVVKNTSGLTPVARNNNSVGLVSRPVFAGSKVTTQSSAKSHATPKTIIGNDKEKNSNHKHIIVMRVPHTIMDGEISARIERVNSTLKIRTSHGKSYINKGISMRSVFITVVSGPIKPNIDSILNSISDWAEDSWRVEKFRSWKDLQKTKVTNDVSCFVEKLQTLQPGKVNLSNLKATFEGFLPKQKFDSGKQNQKN